MFDESIELSELENNSAWADARRYVIQSIREEKPREEIIARLISEYMFDQCNADILFAMVAKQLVRWRQLFNELGEAKSRQRIAILTWEEILYAIDMLTSWSMDGFNCASKVPYGLIDHAVTILDDLPMAPFSKEQEAHQEEARELCLMGQLGVRLIELAGVFALEAGPLIQDYVRLNERRIAREKGEL